MPFQPRGCLYTARFSRGGPQRARVPSALTRRSPAPQLLPPRAPGGADDPAFIARFGTSKAAQMLAAVNPTPLPLAEDAIETHARALIKAAASEAFPPEHFYIFDLGAVYERWRVWTTSLPRVTPYYAGACLCDYSPKPLRRLGAAPGARMCPGLRRA